MNWSGRQENFGNFRRRIGQQRETLETLKKNWSARREILETLEGNYFDNIVAIENVVIIELFVALIIYII